MAKEKTKRETKRRRITNERVRQIKAEFREEEKAKPHSRIKKNTELGIFSENKVDADFMGNGFLVGEGYCEDDFFLRNDPNSAFFSFDDVADNVDVEEIVDEQLCSCKEKEEPCCKNQLVVVVSRVKPSKGVPVDMPYFIEAVSTISRKEMLVFGLDQMFVCRIKSKKKLEQTGASVPSERIGFKRAHALAH